MGNLRRPKFSAALFACFFSAAVQAAPPIAIPDRYVAFDETELSIVAPGFVGNDYDPDGDTFQPVLISTPPDNGSLAAFPDGRFDYLPDLGFTGTDSFVYVIVDANGEEAEGTVTIEVIENPNRPPVAVSDLYGTSTNTMLSIVAPGFVGNDYDPDGDTFQPVLISTPPDNGSLAAFPDGRFDYLPDPGFTGTDAFVYVIADANGEEAEGDVTINVTNPIPGPPVAIPDAYVAFEETELVIAAPGFIGNDYDPDGDAFQPVLISMPPDNGSLSAFPDGSFNYIPDSAFVGTDSFTYLIRDENDEEAEGIVTIEVIENPNRPPVAVDDLYGTAVNTTAVILAPGFVGNDYDPDGDLFEPVAITSTPLNGSVTAFPDGSFQYMPNPGFVGTDSFVYRIRDENGATDEGTVTFGVGGPPTLMLLKEVINEDGGSADAGDFTIILTGADGVHDSGVEYASGDSPMILTAVEYTVTELPVPEYELIGIECAVAGAGPIGENGVFTADYGQDITCTLTNDDLYKATFEVTKDFDDDNPAEVEVTISCNTGLPLEQSTTISEGDGVTFVVTDFEFGAMDCAITETDGATGYATEYFDGTTPSEAGCLYEQVELGEEHLCEITNTLLPVDIEVTKSWIDDNPQFASPYVSEAAWGCVNVQSGSVEGSLSFNGNPDTASFSVFPHWNGTTTCTVTEDFFEGGVESDDSDCEGLGVAPGEGASCEIVNTRLYEGIPTLSRTSLALLAMLMLAVGLVFSRRL